MLSVQGYWFDGKTSVSVRVTLHVDDTGDTRVIHVGDQTVLSAASFADLRVTSRVGNTPRFIYFASGEKFETQDNQAVDQLLGLHQPSFLNTLAHQLESHTYFVIFTLVLVGLISWATIQYGLPAASKFIALRLPQRVMDMASIETLKLLDKTHLKPSGLDESVTARVQQHFANAIQENQNLNLKVIFREGGDIGANAFALPDGTVIFTDEMVNLAKSDDELLAVFAHEIGHVKYRHSLRAAIQSSSLGFFVSALMGDMSAASHMLAALPIILTTLSYSRDFEREADQNALEYLDAHKIPRLNFVTLMERVTYESHCDMLQAMENYKKNAEEKSLSSSEQSSSVSSSESDRQPQAAIKKIPLTEEQLAERKLSCDKLIDEHKKDKHKIMDYFATHPATEERLQKFK